MVDTSQAIAVSPSDQVTTHWAGLVTFLDTLENRGIVFQMGGSEKALLATGNVATLTAEEISRIRDCKAEILSRLSDPENDGATSFPFGALEPNWWELMYPQDRDYATSRPPKRRCPNCGGITRHDPICDELRWRYRMKWGKHKGQYADDLPSDYIKFLFENGYGDSDCRAELRRILDDRQVVYHVFEEGREP